MLLSDSVGGAEDNRKGFGNLIPVKVTDRSTLIAFPRERPRIVLSGSRSSAAAKLQPLNRDRLALERRDPVRDHAAERLGVERRGGGRGEQDFAGPREVLAQLAGEVHLEAEDVVVEVQHV